MEQTLFRILYFSRNCTEEIGDQQSGSLNQILSASRSNNKNVGVTGALMFNAGYFAQVLEGPKREIEKTFERIQRDPRHTDVVVLECSDIASRDFPEWSMARVEPQSEKELHVTGHALQSALEDSDNAGQDVLDLLRSLVVQND